MTDEDMTLVNEKIESAINNERADIAGRLESIAKEFTFEVDVATMLKVLARELRFM
jgi:hypothetical protein